MGSGKLFKKSSMFGQVLSASHRYVTPRFHSSGSIVSSEKPISNVDHKSSDDGDSQRGRTFSIMRETLAKVIECDKKTIGDSRQYKG